MKIINDYDIMEKINAANGKVNMKKIVLNELKINSVATGIGACIQMAIGDGTIERWLIYFGCCSSWMTSNIVLKAVLAKGFVDDKDMLLIMQQLKDLGINTSIELLKKTKVFKTDYKIYKDEESKPVINQKKYFGNKTRTIFI